MERPLNLKETQFKAKKHAACQYSEQQYRVPSQHPQKNWHRNAG
jgi:hypothetical protein